MVDHENDGAFDNRLLGAIAWEDRERLLDHLQCVELKHGTTLFEPDAPLDRVYFPTSGVVSTVSQFEDGTAAEMYTVGTEGAVPAAALLEGGTAVARHIIQVPGRALAVEIERLHDAMQESRGLRKMLFCYVQALLAQIAQSVACNAVHSVEERFARWILMTQDRAGEGDTFALTHHFIAEMLGVHRPTVSLIARTFQRAGLISYQRGVVTVIDRAGLEAVSCECYGIIRREYDRHLPRVARRAHSR